MKAKTNGIALYYAIHGKESAPWLVFGHLREPHARRHDEPLPRGFQPGARGGSSLLDRADSGHAGGDDLARATFSSVTRVKCSNPQGLLA